MKLIPKFNRVVVKRDENIKKSAGGILLSHGAQNIEMNRGTVVSVGPGRHLQNGQLMPMAFEAGDRVLFGDYPKRHEIKINGEDHILLEQEDLFCCIEE